MMWIWLLVLVIFGYIFSHSAATVRGSSDGKCMTNLMNSLANDAFSSSSHQPNFDAHHARVLFDKTNNNNLSGLAWCPSRQIGPEPTEWIQVTFNNLKMISNLLTYGRDSGNLGFLVPSYHLDYQRENGSTWHRHKDKKGNTLISGNEDSRNFQTTKFFSNIVVKTIRIIPISSNSRTGCLRFNLYGCDFDDGVVEYSIPKGDVFSNDGLHSYSLVDKAYDTNAAPAMASLSHGGLGQLLDNQINVKSIQLTEDDDFNFVGWHRNKTQNPIKMIFRFDKVREIKSVRFHILNNFNDNISIFSSAKFEFSIGGEIYGVRAEDIIFNHDVDELVKTARWLKISLNNSLARYLRVSLTFRLDWIIITEVDFETNPVKSVVLAEPTSKVKLPPFEGLQEKVGIDATTKMNYLLTIVGGLVVVALFIFITVFFARRLLRNRKRRFKGKTNPSILYGNMPCNNVIPIPVITNNNGGFYKPVPSGMYDCMLPYQSQTLNVRKGTSFPCQHSQQQFGTFTNRANGSANTNTMINGMSKDNFNATLSPLVGQQSFNQNINTLFPENKRASFDGSYAGTGSNPDYSNPSLIRESILGDNAYLPVHLINMSPAMYGQFNPTNNDHQIGQFQIRIPYNMHYSTDNQPLDPSRVIWSDELADIIENHSRYGAILESPVGGSMTIGQRNGDDPVDAIEDCERNIIDRLLPLETSQIDIQTVIGSGMYGSMHKALYNGSTVVVKSIDANCTHPARIAFIKMISDLLRLSNKNIPRVVGYCSYGSTHESTDFYDQNFKPSISCIVVEHSRYTDLHTFIRMFSRSSSNLHRHSGIHTKTGSDTSSTSVEDEGDDNPNRSLLSQSCLIYMASQISNGMSYLEQEELVHRDLAARNCLLGPRLSIIITDTALGDQQFKEDYISVNEVVNNLASMGLVTQPVRTHHSIHLPLFWMSWEAALKANYSIKSDIWSFGVVLWEILTNCRFQPYFTVPQNPSNLELTDMVNFQCLSLVYNFKCLAQGSDDALLPNNESINQIRNSSNGVTPLPLPTPILFPYDYHSISTPNSKTVGNSFQSSNNHILNTSREMRDLIVSCWSIDPSTRPNFRDINKFLGQKINGFNAEEEYQTLQVGFTKRVEDSDVRR